MSVKVVTYNILTKNYCNPKTYSPPEYSADSVDNTKRYKLLTEVLTKFIAQDAIICLQEVDKVTACDLAIFLKSQNYDFHFDPYGTVYDGYTGVAIALPTKMNVTKIDRYRLASGKEWPTPFVGSHWLNRISLGYLGAPPPNYDVWTKARNKWNTMLSLEIDHTFVVSCVHLPCDYTHDSTMLTYAVLARLRAQTLANGRPFILAGDFNITTDKSIYSALTETSFNLDTLDEDYPPEDTWNPNELNLEPLVSACAKMGNEPSYTNRVVSRAFGKTNEFSGTIDYILVSSHITVHNAEVQPHNTDSYLANSLCPNEYEPSDHVPVMAEVSF
jgi:mRNA deadenylase 3'-5' endonuclease subunit Ccr4